MKEQITIGSRSGLCNRLRFLSLALNEAKKVKMFWPKNTACNATWSELFEDLPNVTFLPCTSSSLSRQRLDSIKGTTPKISLLDLKPKVLLSYPHQRYVAVHVRRTDIEGVLKKYSMAPILDEAFFQFIEDSKIDLVYLATDNAKTQRIFQQRYGERLIVYKPINQFGSRFQPVRCTSVTHAVADLCYCVHGSAFMGTDGSSFTGQIRFARSRF